MIPWLRLVFLVSCAVLFLSTFGYLISLLVLASLKRRPSLCFSDCPPVAVVIPTLNEERDILGKLNDLRRTDYPPDRIRWVIVDGGSKDRTAKIAKAMNVRDERFQFVCFSEARGKADQIRFILEQIQEEVVVLCDADSRLEPSCVRELVSEIRPDQGTVLVAAKVKPSSRLAEERLHWLFINHLWWLEGEVLSCSGLSGVCYALHRPSLAGVDPEAKAEDIHLGSLACRKGWRVRMSRKALASELRVPRTLKEFLLFRKRRGSCYLSELIRGPDTKTKARSWNLVRNIRLWQMTGLPWLMAASLLMGLVLLATRNWLYPVAALILTLLGVAGYASLLSLRSEDPPSWPMMARASFLYIPLLLVSLFLLDKSPPGQGPLGGRL